VSEIKELMAKYVMLYRVYEISALLNVQMSHEIFKKKILNKIHKPLHIFSSVKLYFKYNTNAILRYEAHCLNNHFILFSSILFKFIRYKD